MIVAFLLTDPALHAQVNGTRPSITSLGGQFTFFNPPGVRPSVTSLGPLGYSPGIGFPTCCFILHGKQHPDRDGKRHHDGRRHPTRGGNGKGIFGISPVYPMTYYIGNQDSTNAAQGSGDPASDTADTRAGQSYEEQLNQFKQQLDDLAAAVKNSAPVERRTDPSEQPETILVFRDGHSVEVRNYAIVGQTLYYFSSGYQHKVSLQDLDVPATKRKNDDRGLDFEIPAGQ